MTVLKDISLCAIVRDEKMNPAGGISRFVESHVPFVEQAVIADTGSIDGTREILEEMQSRYSNLKVVDIPFRGYADARNRAMKHVETKRILVLDADELLTHEKPTNDWRDLRRVIEQNPNKTYEFEVMAIPPSGNNYIFYDTSSLRLFDASTNYVRALWECPIMHQQALCIQGIMIKHFVPSQEALKRKKANWYLTKKQELSDKEYIKHFQTSPSQVKGFAEWKAFNPLRDNYK
jgi:glycosyltransferase involved in cell wall biosynthesis